MTVAMVVLETPSPGKRRISCSLPLSRETPSEPFGRPGVRPEDLAGARALRCARRSGRARLRRTWPWARHRCGRLQHRLPRRGHPRGIVSTTIRVIIGKDSSRPPKALRKRTLTNLYNARPQWLADAHAALDAAVAAAYGWSANISDENALRELLELNGR